MNKLEYIGLGTKIEVEDEGHGQTVVLIHGWPITSYHWRFLKPIFHQAGFRTLAVTLRGLGGNSQGEGDLVKLTLAKEVQSLLEKLDINQYAIIGHDWGGTVAYLLSHDNPDKCQALVIEEEILPGVDASIPYPGSAYYPKWHGAFNSVIGLAEELIQGREAIYYRKFLTESAGKYNLNERAISEYISAYTNHADSQQQLRDSLGYYRTQKKDADEISSRMVVPLDVPVLAVGGEYGMGKAVKEGLNKVGNNVSGIVIEDAGHYPFEQTPESCIPIVLEFLKDSLNLKTQN